jgi:hypothetical protein
MLSSMTREVWAPRRVVVAAITKLSGGDDDASLITR